MFLIDFILPRVCHLCGNTLTSKGYICGYCLSRLPRTLYHRNPDNPMALRFAGRVPFVRATGHFFYSPSSPMALLLQDLKYRHFPGIGRQLGEITARELMPTGFFSDIDLLVPVPMHFLKKAWRGYNQTEAIAQGISSTVGIPLSHALTARRLHRTQTSMTHEQRRKNLLNVFKARKLPESIKHILLIDDVCTTGSTLTEAATEMLRANPEVMISMLSICVTGAM